MWHGTCLNTFYLFSQATDCISSKISEGQTLLRFLLELSWLSSYRSSLGYRKRAHTTKCMGQAQVAICKLSSLTQCNWCGSRPAQSHSRLVQFNSKAIHIVGIVIVMVEYGLVTIRHYTVLEAFSSIRFMLCRLMASAWNPDALALALAWLVRKKTNISSIVQQERITFNFLQWHLKKQ